MAIELTEDARLSLPRELMVGRAVMIAFLSVLLFREIASLHDLDGHEQLWLVALLIPLSVGWVWFWWRLAAGSELLAIAVAVTLIVASATAIVVINPIGVFPFYYAVTVAGAAYAWRVSVPLAVATVGLSVFTWGVWLGRHDLWEVLLITSLFGGAAVTVRRFVAAQIALGQSQEVLRQLATSEARADLARDLHDRLGQELTTGVLQAELLVLDLQGSSPAVSPAVQDRADRVLASARNALQLMRETVSGSWTPRVGTELSAARTLLAAAGVSTAVQMRCVIESTRAETVLGWVVREGVTNVLRHSGAHRCSIVIEREDDVYVLTIEDDGSGSANFEPGSGLAGMEHRLMGVGGKLLAAPLQGGGFRLIAMVPVRA